MTGPCAVPECEKLAHCKGLCVAHYLAHRYKTNPAIQKAANKKYYEKNKESILARTAEYARDNRKRKTAVARQRRLLNKKLNPDKYVRIEAERYAKNKEVYKERHRRWSKNNPDKACAMVMTRQARKLRATSKWANQFFISEIYHLAHLRTKITGIKWHVDHIVPLRNKLVCGLHVEDNLQVIPARDNLLKRNRVWPNMP